MKPIILTLDPMTAIIIAAKTIFNNNFVIVNIIYFL